MKGTSTLLDLMLFFLLVSSACFLLHARPSSPEKRVASSFGQNLMLALQSVTLDSLGLREGGLRYKTVIGVLTEEGVLGREEVGRALENALKELCGNRWICTLRAEVSRPHKKTVLLELCTGDLKGRKKVYSTRLHRTLPPPEAGKVEITLELWSR